jgi:hypothetical protein
VSTFTPVEALVAGAACAAATLVLTALAPRIGLVDDARDAPGRKKHARPVPLVGGAALAIALAALFAWSGSGLGGATDVSGVGGVGGGVGVLGSAFGRVLGGEVVPGVAFDATYVVIALALALGVGLADDLAPRGLPVWAKLLGQTLAAIALALGLAVGGEPASIAAIVVCVLLAVAAQ